MNKRIYIMSPASTWASDRYEQFIYLLYHEYPTATIIKQKDTLKCPKGVSAVIFIRGEDRCIDIDMWTQLMFLLMKVGPGFPLFDPINGALPTGCATR